MSPHPRGGLLESPPAPMPELLTAVDVCNALPQSRLFQEYVQTTYLVVDPSSLDPVWILAANFVRKQPREWQAFTYGMTESTRALSALFVTAPLGLHAKALLDKKPPAAVPSDAPADFTRYHERLYLKQQACRFNTLIRSAAAACPGLRASDTARYLALMAEQHAPGKYSTYHGLADRTIEGMQYELGVSALLGMLGRGHFTSDQDEDLASCDFWLGEGTVPIPCKVKASPRPDMAGDEVHGYYRRNHRGVIEVTPPLERWEFRDQLLLPVDAAQYHAKPFGLLLQAIEQTAAA